MKNGPDLLPSVDSSLQTPHARCIKPLHPSHTSSATSELVFLILPIISSRASCQMCDRPAWGVVTVPPFVKSTQTPPPPSSEYIESSRGLSSIVRRTTPQDFRSVRLPDPRAREVCVSLSYRRMCGAFGVFCGLAQILGFFVRISISTTREGDTLARHARASIVSDLFLGFPRRLCGHGM